MSRRKHLRDLLDKVMKVSRPAQRARAPEMYSLEVDLMDRVVELLFLPDPR